MHSRIPPGPGVVKVLVLQDSLKPVGGTEILVLQMLHGLVEQGCTPIAVCRDSDNSSLRGIQVHVVPELFPRRGKPVFAALEAILDSECPDVVHVHKISTPQVIRFAAERIPTIVTVHDHGPYCPGGTKTYWRNDTECTRPLGLPCLVHAYVDACAPRHPGELWHWFNFSTESIRALAGVGRILTLSRYVRARLIDSGIQEDRVRVVPPGIEIQDSTPCSNESSTILFVGRLIKAKGLHVLLEALTVLRTPFKAVVVGDGPLLQYYRDLTVKLGLQEYVRFRGWMDPFKLRMLYQECAVVVVPSLWPEPFGMVGLEAMAHGRPVVAFNVGGVGDWLEDGVNGTLVERGAIAALAVAIERLLTDPHLRIRLGAGGRERVREQFSRAVSTRCLVGNYREVVGLSTSDSSKPRL